MRGEWIEMLEMSKAHDVTLSLPVRGEWIEIIWEIYACIWTGSLSP